jgi:hypothetical protein
VSEEDWLRHADTPEGQTNQDCAQPTPVSTTPGTAIEGGTPATRGSDA